MWDNFDGRPKLTTSSVHGVSGRVNFSNIICERKPGCRTTALHINIQCNRLHMLHNKSNKLSIHSENESDGQVFQNVIQIKNNQKCDNFFFNVYMECFVSDIQMKM